MKKALLFALVSLLSISLISCKKDKETGPKALVNTTWAYTAADETQTLKFTTEKDVEITVDAEGIHIELPATYVYDHPNITITLMGQQVSGTVSGDKMTLVDPDEGEMVFIKK